MEASPKRHALFQETQKQRSEKPLVLKSQSKTRWACHKAASSTLKSRLPAILQTLLNVDESDSKLTSKCYGLISNILSFKFIFSLIVVDEVLGVIDGLSRFLQSENMDVHLARNSALAVIETMKTLHDEGFDPTWEKAMEMSTELKQIISSHNMLHFKEPSLPRNSAFTEVKAYYQSTLHGDGINHAISELEARFSQEHQDGICALAKVVMTPSATAIETEVNLVSELYDLDKSSLLSDRKIVSASITLHKEEFRI